MVATSTTRRGSSASSAISRALALVHPYVHTQGLVITHSVGYEYKEDPHKGPRGRIATGRGDYWPNQGLFSLPRDMCLHLYRRAARCHPTLRRAPDSSDRGPVTLSTRPVSVRSVRGRATCWGGRCCFCENLKVNEALYKGKTVRWPRGPRSARAEGWCDTSEIYAIRSTAHNSQVHMNTVSLCIAVS